MGIPDTAFRHHPELKSKLCDPEQSFFRDLDLEEVDRRAAERGLPANWRRPDEDREANRQAFLTGHDGPLWVFAYGSLMWDPAIKFDELRHATLEGYSRAMCLVDTKGARGSVDQPGLMAGLATGGDCAGMAFRIPAALVADETERLWRREMIADAYYPAFADAATAQGRIRALCFVADTGVDTIDTGLSRDQQVHYIATGTGILGSSRDYLENMLNQFAAMQIDDPVLTDLWAGVTEWRVNNA